MISSPLWYLVKEEKERPSMSLRYVNLFVLLIVLIAVVAINP